MENLKNIFIDKNKTIKAEKFDYIDYLKKLETEEKNNNNTKLEANSKDLLKRCQDLIEDNRLLNYALNERTAKLNKTIQDNFVIKIKNRRI